TPAELEMAERNREMSARLAWKPYMHNPTLERFLPRVTNRALIVWGREDRIVPVQCGEQYRRLLPNATLTVLEKCGHLVPFEQPSTPSCVDVGVNRTAAVLARTTKRPKILLLGNILPIEDNPVRMAEQIAMADLISGGRLLSGFVRGVGVEQWWANSNPVHNRERFEECHDLILKCWTEPGPFRWEGRHY